MEVDLHRRNFMQIMSGAMAAGVVGACAPSLIRGVASPIDLNSFHAARRFARTRFGNIAYVERGSGDVALFLHGFPLNGFQWRGALERLSTRRRCIAPDFLAAGYTEVAPGQDVGVDSQLAMLIALLDELSVETVDLVASDSGGMIAQLFVARHPGRVRTLLLTNCDSEIDCPPPFLRPIIEMAKAGTLVDERFAPMLDPRIARSPKGIGARCYADPSHPTDEAIECYFRPMTRSPRAKELVHAYAASLERNWLSQVEPILKRSTVPVRIVWGMADIIFAKESPDYLDRTFGNSRGVRRLADRKLFWPEELPDVIAAEARSLWDVPSRIDQRATNIRDI
jgi:haloalkane dehalogenase